MPPSSRVSNLLIKYKGFGDILVAIVLSVRPRLIDESYLARITASLTGLPLTSADSAPGFNQSLACMLAAIGVGHVVAARIGPAATSPIIAINLTWAALGFLTCLTPRSWELGSASMLMNSVNRVAFTAGLYIADIWASSGSKTVNRKPKGA